MVARQDDNRVVRPAGGPDAELEEPPRRGAGPRRYREEAAQEAGMSRVYGGIHYEHSCLIGTEDGIKIGSFINQRLKMMRKELDSSSTAQLKTERTSE